MALVFYFLGFLTAACAPSDDHSVFQPESRGGPGLSEDYDSRPAGGCMKDGPCRATCNDIFQSRKLKRNCEKLSVSTVEQMKGVLKILERPDTDKLGSLNLETLKQLLDISPKPLEKTVREMTSRERKAFLVWLAENPEPAKRVSEADGDFKIKEALFGTAGASIVPALKESLAGGDTFVETALNEKNEIVLKWLHDFFGSRCAGKDHDRCVFRNYYCGIVSSLRGSKKPEKRYFDYDFFVETLDAVLENHRPASAPEWWEEEDMEIKYLEDSWTAVCAVRF